MNAFLERIFFGTAILVSSAFSTVGAVISTGEMRWIYCTFAVSSMTAGFMALMFKRADETIRLVIGRCGFSILGGVLATKPVIHHLGFEELAEKELVSLAGIASLVCIGTFFVGYAMLSLLERAAPQIAARWFKKLTE